MSRCWNCALIVVIGLLCGLFGAAVQAQLTPPPPAMVSGTNDGFSDKDRTTLYQCYKMLRSIRTKLFPLDEERRILDMER